MSDIPLFLCVYLVLFYRDSMLVCGLSLLVTLLVRWMNWTTATCPCSMSGIAMKVQGSLLGKLILLQHPQQVRKLI